MRRLIFTLMLLPAATLFAADDYTLGPDSNPQDGVPQGKVTGPIKWTSKIFDGTQRDYWVYVPAQYKAEQPACVMVFQDGASYVHVDGAGYVPLFEKEKRKAQFRVPV